MDWHSEPAEDVAAALRVGPDGLTSDEARERLRRAGPNRLPEASGPSALSLLLAQVRTPLMWALLASAALALALGEVADGLVVLAVVIINALIGFAQEYQAGRAIASLAELVAEPARVRRDGTWVEIPAHEVVPGDVLEVAQGDRVAADVRLLDAAALRVQESALTGESEPVDKGVAAVEPDAPLAERSSVLYAGTVIAAGSGRGVAVATGAGTELGRISELIEGVEELQTPLTRELDRFGRVITAAIGVFAVALVVVAVVRGFALGDAALAGISLAVAAVPEGLPAVVTIALAVGVRRMARRRAIVRHLPAVETLGSTTVVASDKTGTLTQNRMTVEAAWGERDELLLASALCNDAQGTLGDPTETALLEYAAAAGVDVAGARAAHPRLGTLPFDASRKLMTTLHAGVLYVKGAPEAVLPRVAAAPAASGPPAASPPPAATLAGVAAEVDRQAALGRRVLVFAARDGATDPEPGDGLRLIGLVALVDPPRPGVADAIAACHAAGIRVEMVTGDHPRTARAIGAQIGLGDEPAVTGAELDAQPEEELGRATIYARVAPEHKLRLVRAQQRRGEVVAVTGDGVNDAPALRQADIGVAMGRGGTAAAKEAADMVLADDDFSTLRAAIEEGRRVYDNLVKALAFVLPTSVGQALIVAVSVFAFPPGVLPVTPVQILWINLIVAVALALPLALEAPEPDVMERPPRDRSQALLDRPLLVRTLVVSVTLTAVALGLFELARSNDLALARAQTTAVTGAVILQAWYLLTCRSLTRPNREIGRLSNPSVYAGIAIVLALQALLVYAPFMQSLFGTDGLGLRELAWAAVAALAILPVTWLEERWRVSRARR
ncbi:MAG TPA: HAD-IC family P-type ATPase [Solirubrobacter sp.]|nr:HAD-IC family P-type ATPase [Solirubrobacter sp.]